MADLTEYRLEQLEGRVGRMEKFIFGVLVGGACLSGTLLWMLIDLPSKVVKQQAYYNETHERRSGN